MLYLKNYSSALLLLASISFSTQADDFFMGSPDDGTDTATECKKGEEGCEAKWESSVEFGYVGVSSNQDSSLLNAQLKLAYEVEKWRHEGYLSLVESSTEEEINGVNIETESEKFAAQARSDYKFSKKAYAFGIFDYDETKDSGFEHQMSLSAGLGYRLIKSDVHELDGELGFGTRRSKTEETLLLPSETNSESITRAAAKYLWIINKKSKFEQKVSSEIGEDNTITRSYTGLSTEIVADLDLKFSYLVKHQSEVPVGNEKTETITAVSVVYTF